MYRIIKENEVVAVVDKLHFCRPQANGIPCLTDEANAHGIVIDDAFFHIEGFPEWEGKETVKYEELRELPLSQRHRRSSLKPVPNCPKYSSRLGRGS